MNDPFKNPGEAAPHETNPEMLTSGSRRLERADKPPRREAC
jgi:hypothetical protein